MKVKRKIKNEVCRAVAVLIFGVFFLITAVQAFHNHNTTSLPLNDDDTEYVYSSEKCFICYYVIHKQSHQLHLAYPPVLIKPVTKAVTLLSRSYAGIYKFTLQGFTNKGPPAVSC